MYKKSPRKDSIKASGKTDHAFCKEKAPCCHHHPNAHDNIGCLIKLCDCITSEEHALHGIVRLKTKISKKRRRDALPIIPIGIFWRGTTDELQHNGNSNSDNSNPGRVGHRVFMVEMVQE